MQRIFVDTNVLFPFSVMDLMLALTEDGVHDVLWTNALLDEWEHVVTRDHGRSPSTAASITKAVREHFADSEVPEADYTPFVADMPGDDQDDRIHMAAAVAARASTIVTWNSKDFPTKPLARHGVRVIDPDVYLCELANTLPNEVQATVARVARGKRRPPMSTGHVLDALHKAGIPNFVAVIRARSDPGAT